MKKIVLFDIALIVFLLLGNADAGTGGREIVNKDTVSEQAGDATVSNLNEVSFTDQANGFIEAYLTPKLSTPIIGTPEDYGMEYEEVSFETQDGVEISGWLIKGGRDKVIIQAHTVTSNRSGSDSSNGGPKIEFLKTAKGFFDAGYSVLTFDARNHGQSEIGPQPYIIGTIDDAPDFVAAVDYLANRPEYSSARVGIHAICFGSNATASAFGLKDGLQSRSNLKAISLTQPASWGMLLRNNPNVPEALVNEINVQLAARDATDLDQHPLKYAGMITVPAMIVQNRNDPHFSKSFIEEFYNNIPSEKVMLWIDGEEDRSYAYYHETIKPEKLIEWFDRHL